MRSGDWKLLLDGERAMMFNLRRTSGSGAGAAAERADVARGLRARLARWHEAVNAEAKQAAPR